MKQQKQTYHQPSGLRLIRYSLLAAVGLLIMVPAVALAAQSASNNYQVNEVFFGSGGELNACSTSYCSKQSAGETVVGNTKSANFQANAGFNTDRTPYIEFTTSNTNVNLGTLHANSTATTTASFTVKAYLAQGYSVVNASDGPDNNGHELAAMGTLGAEPSMAGTEQFGINLRANTSPTTFGADPIQLPDNTFGFGTVALEYNTPDNYRYVKNDIVARSTKSSSYTTFTVSYVFNVSNVTPGGNYVLRHVLVATGTY